jgi:multicomponent Na+:H+ antiporter subunit G
MLEQTAEMMMNCITIAADSATTTAGGDDAAAGVVGSEGRDGPLMTGLGVRDGFAIVAMLGGLFFMLVGSIGVYRFPDCYSRMHAASKCTTLGITGLLLAAVLHIWELDVAGKGVLVLVFTFVATPIGTHLLAKAAHHGGARQFANTLSDELAEDKADHGMAINDEQIGVVPQEELRGEPGHLPPPRPANPSESVRPPQTLAGTR